MKERKKLRKEIGERRKAFEKGVREGRKAVWK